MQRTSGCKGISVETIKARASSQKLHTQRLQKQAKPQFKAFAKKSRWSAYIACICLCCVQQDLSKTLWLGITKQPIQPKAENVIPNIQRSSTAGEVQTAMSTARLSECWRKRSWNSDSSPVQRLGPVLHNKPLRPVLSILPFSPIKPSHG